MKLWYNLPMQLIKTASFELAIYAHGEKTSSSLALVLPGKLDTKDYPHMKNHVGYLSARNYLALSFDPPGTWESPGGIELYTMTNYLKAINELIEYFGDRPTVLMGHSRGGTMAMLAGSRNDRVTHIIAAMSHSSASGPDKRRVKGDVQIEYRDTPPNNDTRKKEFDLPLNYFKDASQYDVLNALRHCMKPKLFFLGTKDTIVTPAEVREDYAEAAEPKRLHELISDHDYRRHPHVIEEVNRVMGDFLDEN